MVCRDHAFVKSVDNGALVDGKIDISRGWAWTVDDAEWGYPWVSE